VAEVALRRALGREQERSVPVRAGGARVDHAVGAVAALDALHLGGGESRAEGRREGEEERRLE
jgi:hypothetical protein